MSAAPEAGYALGYGPLENAIATLCDAPADAVRVRFRKFRLRDYPDQIQIGSGSRVQYDLRRALALCAAFAVSNGLASQGEAVTLVTATWPEWCRALIAAAVETGLMARPSEMPGDAGAVVSLIPNGFATPNGIHIATTTSRPIPPHAPAACAVSVNAGAVLDVLASAPAASGDIGAALHHLNVSFGWSRSRVPLRAGIEDMPPQRGFLDDGPYFTRAAALLHLCEQVAHPVRHESDERDAVPRWKMKILSDYLQRPPPLDAWKREVGHEENGPRLGHLLTICAREAGVQLAEHEPHSPIPLAGAAARAAAREMIALGVRKRGRRAATA